MQIRFSGVELIGRPEVVQPPPNRPTYRSNYSWSGEGFQDANRANFKLSDEDLNEFHDLFLSDEKERKLIECSANKIDSGKNLKPLWSRIGIEVIAGLGRVKIWDGSGVYEIYPSEKPQLEFLERVLQKADFRDKGESTKKASKLAFLTRFLEKMGFCKNNEKMQKAMVHGIRVAKAAREEEARAVRI